MDKDIVQTKPDFNRRKLLKVAGLGALASAWTLTESHSKALPESSLEPVLRFAHLTDMHIKPGPEAESGVRKCLDHILKNEKQVDFCVNGGDIIMDALGEDFEAVEAQWAVWRRIRADYPSLKFHHCIGNHDVWGKTPHEEEYPGKAWVMQEHEMERPFYTFEAKGWHFIVLDSTIKKPDGNWYTARLDTDQMQWLEKTLEEIPSSKPVLVVSHIPILGATPFLDGDNAKSGDWIVPGAWMHTDSKDLIRLFDRYKNVKVCISGHIHILESLLYNDIHYHCSGAVAGNWWSDEPYEFTPRGYALFELFADGSHNFEYIRFE